MDEQTTPTVETTPEQRLELLARFESLFATENIIQGFGIWVRSSAPMLAITLFSGLLGLAQAIGPVYHYLAIALTFYLLHVAAAREARLRWNIQVLSSTWWSIYWRVLVYVLPVSIVLVLIMPVDLAGGEEALVKNAWPLLIAGLIVQIVSIVPTGVAASGAFLIAIRRRRILEEMGIRPGRPLREDDDGKTPGDHRENG